jgi:hypothetical protein
MFFYPKNVLGALWEQDAAGSSPVTSTKISGFDRKNSKPQGITLRFFIGKGVSNNGCFCNSFRF